MHFGVILSSSWSVKQIVESAVIADEADLDFLLVTDHYMTRQSNRTVDAWTILAALAQKTERIRLGTCVTPIPFRPPAILAKVVATVDHLSDGRTILGVGAGWHRPEFDAYSIWNENRIRVAKTREGIQLITRLWTAKEPLDFQGKYYAAKGAVLEPKPLQQPHPPLWFGTTGDSMLKLALHYGDGWVPPGVTIGSEEVPVEVYESVLTKLKESRRKGEKAIKVNFTGSLNEIAEKIAKFTEMGFDGAILAKTPPAEIPQAIRRFAADIVPSYSRYSTGSSMS